MAFGILQTFLGRVEALGIVGELPELGSVLRQIQSRDDRFEEVDYEFQREERPPMREIPAYRKKFGLDA